MASVTSTIIDPTFDCGDGTQSSVECTIQDLELGAMDHSHSTTAEERTIAFSFGSASATFKHATTKGKYVWLRMIGRTNVGAGQLHFDGNEIFDARMSSGCSEEFTVNYYVSPSKSGYIVLPPEATEYDFVLQVALGDTRTPPEGAEVMWIDGCALHIVLPAQYLLTPPEGLTVTWPSYMGANQKVNASITAWGYGEYTLGTPSGLPSAQQPDGTTWNFRREVYSMDGNFLNAITQNTKEEKSVSMWAVSTGNHQYQLKMVVTNNFGQSVESGLHPIYTEPGPVEAKIKETIIDKENMTWGFVVSWEKDADGGALPVDIVYYVNDSHANPIGPEQVVASFTTGEAQTGEFTVSGLTDTMYQVFVRCRSTAGYGAMSGTTPTAYMPIGQAHIGELEWNDTRDTLTINGSAEFATQLEISAGYARYYSDAGRATTANPGKLTISGLNHGTGQMLYVKVAPVGEWGMPQDSKAAYGVYEVPNPILGLVKNDCDTESYIVDMVEKKAGSETCSARWSNGQRVVLIGECPPQQG